MSKIWSRAEELQREDNLCKMWSSGRPSNVYDADRWTKLTALETISRWLLLKKRKNHFLSHPLGHFGVTYALHLWLLGKPVVEFLFVVIELFRYLIRLRRYERISVEVGVFRKGGGSFWPQVSKGRGHRPSTIVGVIKLEWLPYRVVSKYPQSII